MNAYAIENPVIAALAMTRTSFAPARSTSAPVSGAENAEAYVSIPRNSPDANVLPPSARMWNGAVGKSWNADRNTVKEKPHITKKRGVKRRSGNQPDSIESRNGSRPFEFQAVETVAEDPARAPDRCGEPVLGGR